MDLEEGLEEKVVASVSFDYGCLQPLFEEVPRLQVGLVRDGDLTYLNFLFRKIAKYKIRVVSIF